MFLHTETYSSNESTSTENAVIERSLLEAQEMSFLWVFCEYSYCNLHFSFTVFVTCPRYLGKSAHSFFQFGCIYKAGIKIPSRKWLTWYVSAVTKLILFPVLSLGWKSCCWWCWCWAVLTWRPCQLLMLPCQRGGWEVTQPGQLISTDPRDIPGHMESSSAHKSMWKLARGHCSGIGWV